MKIRNTLSGILGLISFGSALISSGVKESADWFIYARPYLTVAILTGIVALILYKWDLIRRVTYPATVCMNAWLYQYGFIHTEFGRATYRLYKHFGRSYRKLFGKVQDAFDYYMMMEVE